MMTPVITRKAGISEKVRSEWGYLGEARRPVPELSAQGC